MLKKTVFFRRIDERYLRRAGEVLADQLDEILDVWFGAHPHLLAYFAGPDGAPDPRYVLAVRQRSGQWILDTCRRAYDRAWLDHVYQIGLRHHRTKKNLTDGVASAPHIPLRYLIAFTHHTIAMIRPFLTRKGHPATAVAKMHAAWSKSVILQVAVWSRAYTREADW